MGAGLNVCRSIRAFIVCGAAFVDNLVITEVTAKQCRQVSLVLSRLLDHCNAILMGLPASILAPLSVRGSMADAQCQLTRKIVSSVVRSVTNHKAKINYREIEIKNKQTRDTK